MGCCASIEQDNSAKIHNDKIEEQLRQDMLDAKNEVKLLLLGKKERGYMHVRTDTCCLFFKVPANQGNQPF